MSVLGDRIVQYPVKAGDLAIMPTAAEWNGLRDELIELRARAENLREVRAEIREAEDYHRDVPAELLRWGAEEWRGCAPETTGGITMRCPVCNRPMPSGMVECAGCAGSEDAAAKRQADQ